MIRKALIPVAGLGTRLRPLTTVVPKALLPLIDEAGRVRPVVQFICAEAQAAGVEQIGLIVLPEQEETFRRYFAAARAAGDLDVRAEIQYIPAEAKGFGYAVQRGRDFVGDEAFLVMLGDHVYQADAGRQPCAAQVAKAFDAVGGAAMIGMQPVAAERLDLVGVARGEPVGEGIYLCTHFVEKPDAALARQTLTTPGLPEGQYLAHCGIYVFTAEIFQCLADVGAEVPAGKELQLADAQSLLLKRHPNGYHLVRIAGRSLDTGTPAGYAAALEAMARGRGPAPAGGSGDSATRPCRKPDQR